jgi:hypothetical protein
MNQVINICYLVGRRLTSLCTAYAKLGLSDPHGPGFRSQQLNAARESEIPTRIASFGGSHHDSFAASHLDNPAPSVRREGYEVRPPDLREACMLRYEMLQ